MQRLFTTVKTLSAIGATLSIKSVNVLPVLFNNLTNTSGSRLLMPCIPLINPSCSFKVKGRVRRRCKSCYFVVRDERLYVICPKYPRHKQMAMKPKPHNTWILTHASQSQVRPW